MKSEAFLDEIRRAEGLARAVLQKISVEGREVCFYLVTDRSYTQEEVAYASEVAGRYVPAGFSARANVFKCVPSEEGVRAAVAELLKTKYPSAAAFLVPTEIAVTVDGKGGSYRVPLPRELDTQGIADYLTAELQKRFCGTWYGEIYPVAVEKGPIEEERAEPAEVLVGPRTFPVEDYAPIDGAAPKSAVYIADLGKEMQGVTVCGTLSYIEERAAKNGKPYFSLTVSDGTGSLRVSYFSRKATVEKVRALAAGDTVCVTGDNELYNGGLSFRAQKLDRGAPPENFVPEARPSRPVPFSYKCVFPSPAADYVQADLFSDQTLPEVLKKQDFVVFDLETTGLNRGGVMDRIIEVGAVKIKGGRISEKFSTFVACPTRLPEEIVSLTGITDDMLAGAPATEDVIADFYKFTAGCALVAHNAPFDCKFIRYYGEKEGYLFDNRQFDTVTFAQEMLRLPNYKLNTVADRFGFTFNHHRAFDDAFVTAKIFIELVKMKGGLPRA